MLAHVLGQLEAVWFQSENMTALLEGWPSETFGILVAREIEEPLHRFEIVRKPLSEKLVDFEGWLGASVSQEYLAS